MDKSGELIISTRPQVANAGPAAPVKSAKTSKFEFIFQWRDHWMQSLYYLPRRYTVQRGSVIKLSATHDEYAWWFNVISSEGKNAEDTVDSIPPVCTCGVHG